MRAGLIASLVVHVVVLVAGAVSLNFGKELTTAPVDSLPVDLVPVSELTKLQLGTKEAKEIKEAALQPTKKPAEKPEPEKKTGEAKKEVKKVQEAKKEVQQAETPPPPPEPAEPEPAPKEVPKEKAPAETAELGPEVEKTEKPKQVVKVRPRSKPKPPARPKAPKKEEPKKKEDFNSKMAALLNKTNAKSSGTAKSAKPASLGSELGQTNVKMSQSELDALRGQVARCWNPPVGAAGAEDLNVRLEFNLSRTGEVEGQIKVLNSSSNPTFRAAASSAERAVYRCGPYSLPAAKYDAWKTVILNFDPRDMLGY
ncbi:hypothetical protein PsW64_00793 [Pseudovibrio sp. W64]|uniref:hypothetical protein n=1 Tax=unclassified Pseudovibrio TaxID=2627060 RepID=UPI0007AE8FEF|nr:MULTISPECIES: hypothetical protein [unclassified Pseudovibrio]KZK76784.1 hypothetical protein PsAD46_05205 [Pseudovibrio sp. Ad46]KZK85891.1 hypothetical protein PsAD13_01020 [Pseudovibrio sp. Ad13]KZK88231.1 hypothetical protein PsW64_00793 [Pseudovibrio sp. W64]